MVVDITGAQDTFNAECVTSQYVTGSVKSGLISKFWLIIPSHAHNLPPSNYTKQ